MIVEHFIVFVGATAPLSSELGRLEKALSGVKVIAPAAKKKRVGLNSFSTEQALSDLCFQLSDRQSRTSAARLTVWFYEPEEPKQFEDLWSTFGHCARVEIIPRKLIHKVRQTREFIEKRISCVLPLLHLLSYSAVGQRKTAPISLPLRNFRSRLTDDLRQFWYHELNVDDLKRRMKSFKNRYIQLKNRDTAGYVDDSSLVFAPAKDEALHGQAHPTGSTQKSFACGRFRYGVALFPGFHFDVSALKTATIQRELRTSDGGTRKVKSENREYVNIFPNDHILPK